MDEHPNVTIVRELYAAFSRGDVETIRGYLADDAVWHAAGRNWIVGDYQGRDTVVGLLTAMAVYAEGSYSVEVRDVLGNCRRAIGLHRSSARRADGRSLDVDDVLIFDISDGKVIEVWASPYDQYEEDAFYGPEAPAGLMPPARVSAE